MTLCGSALCDIAVDVAGHGHVHRHIQNQQLGQLGIQGDSAAAGGEGILFIIPSVIGSGLGHGFGIHLYRRSIVIVCSLESNLSNQIITVVERLVFSILALPASAATFTCPQCKQYTFLGDPDYIYWSSYHVMDGSCPKESGNHPHSIYKFTYPCVCDGCGYMGSSEVYRDYCILDDFP